MKILVLGGSGHIGKRLAEVLKNTAWATPIIASRGKLRDAAGSVATIQADALDLAGLSSALRGVDAVVNCVAGDARSIAAGMHTLVQAALGTGCRRIVHLSTMSVYGPVEGRIQEDAPLHPGLGWYGRAKCEAEIHLGEFVRQGGEAVLLRPGCVFGPGSELWVGRIGRWLKAGRLGDLGEAGDGWSNLVHVDDVCQAVVAALHLPARPGELPAFNLAGPDSPRWNQYFVDLALALQATPVRRIGRRQLQFDAFIASPPLKAAQRVWTGFAKSAAPFPDPMPPGLTHLWAQHIHLDWTQASSRLGVVWTPYAAGLQSSAGWFAGKDPSSAHKIGHALWTH